MLMEQLWEELALPPFLALLSDSGLPLVQPWGPRRRIWLLLVYDFCLSVVLEEPLGSMLCLMCHIKCYLKTHLLSFAALISLAICYHFSLE